MDWLEMRTIDDLTDRHYEVHELVILFGDLKRIPVEKQGDYEWLSFRGSWFSLQSLLIRQRVSLGDPPDDYPFRVRHWVKVP